MKIGIVSMQRIHNYGSFLQAFSLKKQLESRGADVFFIDIQAGRKLFADPPSPSLRSLLRKADRYFFKRIQNYFFEKKMNAIHETDAKIYLEIEKKPTDNAPFDLVIIGSDEVFHALAESPWGFSLQLFGQVDHAERVISYAACCGTTTYEQAYAHHLQEEIAGALKNLAAVSVRDENTRDFVRKMIGIDSPIHVDPVFLSDFDRWIPALPPGKPYLLVYAYSNRISDGAEIAAIRAYAARHRLRILSVGTQQRWCDHNLTANAFTLLAYVKNARAVITDTFHGAVFSMKYQKDFVAVVREGNRQKLGGLLDQFMLSDRVWDRRASLEDAMRSPIDYAAVQRKISEEVQKAGEYLDREVRRTDV